MTLSHAGKLKALELMAAGFREIDTAFPQYNWEWGTGKRDNGSAFGRLADREDVTHPQTIDLQFAFHEVLMPDFWTAQRLPLGNTDMKIRRFISVRAASASGAVLEFLRTWRATGEGCDEPRDIAKEMRAIHNAKKKPSFKGQGGWFGPIFDGPQLRAFFARLMGSSSICNMERRIDKSLWIAREPERTSIIIAYHCIARLIHRKGVGLAHAKEGIEWLIQNGLSEDGAEVGDNRDNTKVTPARGLNIT